MEVKVPDDDKQHVPAWWTDPTVNVQRLVNAAMKRQDDLHTDLRREVELHIAYTDKLRAAETARIDAIRAVDVSAADRAAAVLAAQQQALAEQVRAAADAFRASIATALEPIQKDIRDLRDAQARGVGVRNQVVEARDVGSASRLNVGMIVSIVAVAVTIIGLIVLYANK
jgi:hypothetical protein